LLVACAFVVLAASAVRADEKEKFPAEKLAGTWKLVGNSDKILPEEITIFVEFTKDGKVTVRVEPKDKTADPITMKGKYKLEKDKIDYSIETPDGTTKEEVLTIKKLDDDNLVTVDPKGIQEDFKRVKEKKKEEKKPN
jgi:uncharacterized protein (TIGR03066 family)